MRWWKVGCILSIALHPQNRSLNEIYLRKSSPGIKPWEITEKLNKLPVILLEEFDNPVDRWSRVDYSALDIVTANGISMESMGLLAHIMEESPCDTLEDLVISVNGFSFDWKKDAIGDKEDNRVYVGTMHSSKSMEWDVVHIPHCHDGSMPMRTAPEGEEMRLLYVACTRARRCLSITWPMNVNASFVEHNIDIIGTARSKFLNFYATPDSECGSPTFLH